MSSSKTKDKKGSANWHSPIFLFTLLLTTLLMGCVVTSLIMILLIGMGPTFVAFITDQDDDRCLSYCVMLCNLWGVIPFIVQNINESITMASGLAIIQNPINIIIMMASAGLGWTIFYIIPQVTIYLAKSRDGSKLSYLRQRYFILKEDWGNALPESELIESVNSLDHPRTEREEDLPSAQSVIR